MHWFHIFRCNEKTGKPFLVESASHVAGMKKARGNALNH